MADAMVKRYLEERKARRNRELCARVRMGRSAEEMLSALRSLSGLRGKERERASVPYRTH